MLRRRLAKMQTAAASLNKPCDEMAIEVSKLVGVQTIGLNMLTHLVNVFWVGHQQMLSLFCLAFDEE